MIKQPIKSLMTGTFVLLLHPAQSQYFKDSATYKKTVIELYKQHTQTPDYVYNAKWYSDFEQDTLFRNALAWKKQTLDYPVILEYMNIEPNTREAKDTLAALESDKVRYQQVVTQAVAAYQKKHPVKEEKHVSVGLSNDTAGKIENRDREIKEKVLKTWHW